MHRKGPRGWPLARAVIVAATAVGAATGVSARVDVAAPSPRRAADSDAGGAVRAASAPPVLFLEDGPAVHPRVDLRAPLADGALYLGADGMTRVLLRGDAAWAVRRAFPGARPDGRFEPAPDSLARTRFHFHRRGARSPRAGVRAHRAALLRDLLPGIDLRVDARHGAVEYSFHVAPGADVSDLRVRWEGASVVRRAGSGNLVVETPVGAWEETAPRAWQVLSGGARVDVAAAWESPVSAGDLAFEARILLGPVDAALPLIVDPAFPAHAGYVGGNGSEVALGVAAAADGSAVLVGETTSGAETFPETVGPVLLPGANLDGFVARVAADGTELEWCGYVGGDGFDSATAVALDADGSVVLVGRTTSDGDSFPVTPGPRALARGQQDAFVTRVSPDGETILSSGFLGGAASDMAWAVALTATGDVVVAGETFSSAASFPVLGGPDLVHNGAADAFVARLADAGGAVLWCGYLGGAADDRALGVAVDPITGRIFVGGATESGGGFPSAGSPGGSVSGGADGFVAAITADGASLAWSGRVGGSQADRIRAVAAGPEGSMHFGGWTESADLPARGGPDLSPNGGRDGMVGRVGPDGVLAALGWVGGAGADEVAGIAVHSDGRATVAGTTQSTHATFPPRGGPSMTHGGFRDVFIGGLKSAGRGWRHVGFIGGSGLESAEALALVPGEGQPVVAGAGETLPVAGGPSLAYGGSVDAIVVRIDPSPYLSVATVTLTVTKGVMKDSPKSGKDAFQAKGGFQQDGDLGGTPFDRASEPFDLWYGDARAPRRLRIAAGDPAWKAKGTALRWKSPKGALPRVALAVDPGKGTWSVKVTRLQFAAPPSGDVGITVQAGRWDGDLDAAWVPGKPGTLKAP